MKSVLVTGGAGFIGSNLIQLLAKHNYNIFSIDDYSTGNFNIELPNVTYLKMDIKNISDFKEKVDTCFHLAAKTMVQESFNKIDEYFSTNVDGTLNIAKWASTNKVKLIYAGSGSKHSNTHSSPYALTKYLGEEICRLFNYNYDLNLQIARFYNVYGPGEKVDPINANVIGIWRSRIEKRLPLQIVGDGEQKRDFIHVGDIANGLMKIANLSENFDEVWELGSGTQHSINQLYKYFQKRFPKIHSEIIDDQPGNFKNSFRVNDNMSNKLNWQPKFSLEEYIRNLN